MLEFSNDNCNSLFQSSHYIHNLYKIYKFEKNNIDQGHIFARRKKIINFREIYIFPTNLKTVVIFPIVLWY